MQVSQRIFQSDAIKEKGEVKGYNITILDGDKQYIDTAENFKLDSNADIETSVIYNDNEGICIINGEYTEYPNSKYDVYINNIGTYINAKNKREYVPPSEPTEEELIQQQAIEAKTKLNEQKDSLLMAMLTGADTSPIISSYAIMLTSISDEVAEKVPDMFPTWDGNSKAYKKDDRVTYNGTLYKVLQDHTSQSTWTPEGAPSFFAKVLTSTTGEPQEWEQPDSTNPYMKGDKVIYNGKTYESLIDNNVWSPDAYPAGWQEVG